MTFIIIGTGNIAWFLGKKLTAAGNKCIGVYSHNLKAASELSDILLAAHFGTISDVSKDADVCFIAVSDTAISIVASQISFTKTVLIHTGGAVELKQIMCAAKDCAVLWPIYSIQKNNIPSHRNIPCGWEATTPKAEKYVLAMGHTFSDNLFEAKGEQRKWLHLAAVMNNNFINHLLTISEEICLENNIQFSVLYPILEQTFENIKNHSPKTVQTGPAIRRDYTTINEHLALLQKHPKWQNIYQTITESIQNNEEVSTDETKDS